MPAWRWWAPLLCRSSRRGRTTIGPGFCRGLGERRWVRLTLKFLPVLRARESKIIYAVIHSTVILLSIFSGSGMCLALGIRGWMKELKPLRWKTLQTTWSGGALGEALSQFRGEENDEGRWGTCFHFPLIGACLSADGEKGPQEGVISQLRHEWWSWTSQTKGVGAGRRRETKAHLRKWGKSNLAEMQARGGQLWSWCLAASLFPQF